MNTQVSRWYQEPLVLLVFGIPLATVVAGLVTVWIAVQAADVDTARDINRFGMQSGTEQTQ